MDSIPSSIINYNSKVDTSDFKLLEAFSFLLKFIKVIPNNIINVMIKSETFELKLFIVFQINIRKSS